LHAALPALHTKLLPKRDTRNLPCILPTSLLPIYTRLPARIVSKRNVARYEDAAQCIAPSCALHTTNRLSRLQLQRLLTVYQSALQRFRHASLAFTNSNILLQSRRSPTNSPRGQTPKATLTRLASLRPHHVHRCSPVLQHQHILHNTLWVSARQTRRHDLAGATPGAAARARPRRSATSASPAFA